MGSRIPTSRLSRGERRGSFAASLLRAALLVGVVACAVSLAGCAGGGSLNSGELPYHESMDKFVGAWLGLRDLSDNEVRRLVVDMAAGETAFTSVFDRMWPIVRGGHAWCWEKHYCKFLCMWRDASPNERWEHHAGILLVAIREVEVESGTKTKTVARFQSMAWLRLEEGNQIHISGVFVPGEIEEGLEVCIPLEWHDADGHTKVTDRGKPVIKAVYNGRRFDWLGIDDAKGHFRVGETPAWETLKPPYDAPDDYVLIEKGVLD